MLAIVKQSSMKRSGAIVDYPDRFEQCEKTLNNRKYPGHQDYHFTLRLSLNSGATFFSETNLKIEYLPLFGSCICFWWYKYIADFISDSEKNDLQNNIIRDLCVNFKASFLKHFSPFNVQSMIDDFISENNARYTFRGEKILLSLVQVEMSESAAADDDEVRYYDENMLWQKNESTGEMDVPNMDYINQQMAIFNSDNSPQESIDSFLAMIGNDLAKKIYHPERANFFIIPIMQVADALNLILCGKFSGHYWSANTRTRRGDVVLFYLGRGAKETFFSKCNDELWIPFFNKMKGAVFGTARIITDIFDDEKRGYGGKWVFFSDVFIYDEPVDIFELQDEFGNPVSGEITRAGFFRPKFLPEGSSFLSAFRKADAGRSPHFRITRPDNPSFPDGDADDDLWAEAFRNVADEKFISEESVKAYFALPLLKLVLPYKHTIDACFEAQRAAVAKEKVVSDAPDIYLPVFFRMNLGASQNAFELRAQESETLQSSPLKTIIVIGHDSVYKISAPGRQNRCELLLTRKTIAGNCIRRLRCWFEDYFYEPDSLKNVRGD